MLLDAENDTRSAAQKERDSIKVTESVTKEADTNENEKTEEQKEQEDDSDSDEDNEDDKEDDEDKSNEETDDEKAIRVAKEKEDRKQERMQKRINRITAEKEAFKAEVDKLTKALAAKPKEGVTEEDIERLAEEKATKKLNEQRANTVQKEFEKNCDVLEKAALKINKDFADNVQEMVEEIGKPIPALMINVMAELDNENGGAVLNYLANNIDEAEELYDLSERKLTQKLIRISDKLKAEEKPLKKKSSVPEPLKPLSEGNSGVLNKPLTGKEDMETFVRIRAKQVEERRKARGY